MAVEVITIVHDEGLYVGGGMVDRWFKRMGNNLWHKVVAAAPQRTGELKSMIDLDFNRFGLRIINCQVSSNAPHTQYVIGGTADNGAGYIYSNEGWHNRFLVDRIVAGHGARGEDTKGLWMTLNDRRQPNRLLRVHGQRANNFLLTGYNATARTHAALHPIHPGLIT